MFSVIILTALVCLALMPKSSYSQSNSTLPSRGAAFASGPSQRESIELIFGDQYDPVINPNGLVNLGAAENAAMIDEVSNYVEGLNFEINPSVFRLSDGGWGSRRLRVAMANHINSNFQVHNPYNETDILFGTGVTGIFEMLGFSLFNRGDGLMMTMPTYPGFVSDFAVRAGVVPIFVRFDGVDPFSPESIIKFEETYAQTTNTTIRAIIICNPHNPLGLAYPRDTIIAIMQFAAKHNLHVISDEVYGLSTYDVPSSDAPPFQSVASFHSSAYIDPNYVHILYGMSKDFASSGLRLGCLFTKNEELNRAVTAMNGFSWSGNPVQQIATLMLEDEAGKAALLATSRATTANRSQYLRSILDNAGIEYSRRSNAGYYLWVDLRPFLPPVDDPWEAEGMLVQAFFQNRVFILHGAPQHAENAGFFRLCFSQEISYLQEGLRRMFAALQGVETEAAESLRRSTIEI